MSYINLILITLIGSIITDITRVLFRYTARLNEFNIKVIKTNTRLKLIKACLRELFSFPLFARRCCTPYLE